MSSGQALAAERHRPAALQSFPLTDLQQSYWAAQMSRRGSAYYFYERVSEELDLARFEQVWQRLVDRHEMLRAEVGVDGQWKVHAEVPRYTLPIVDLRDVPAQEAERRLDELRAQLSASAPAPDQWPLVRIHAVRLAGRTHLFFINSLLVIDFLSFRIIEREGELLYRQPEAELPPLEFSFRDYVLARQGPAMESLRESARAYWLGRLPELPPPPALPMARQTNEEQPRWLHAGFRLDARDWSRLKERAKAVGVTASTVLLGAYAEVLAGWSTHRRCTITALVQHREPVHPQVTSILGNFSFPLPIEVAGDLEASFEERLRLLQTRFHEALEHRHMNGVQVARELNRQEGKGPRARFPVAFSSSLSGRRPERTWTGLLKNRALTTTDVWLDMQTFEEESGGLMCYWDAQESLFPPGLIQDLIQAHEEFLCRLARYERPWREQRPSVVPTRQLQRRAHVNATTALVPRGLLHEPFLTHALAQPARTAVITPELRLSYGELHQRSNLWAHRLRSRGCGRNELVAVVMKKGWEQLVAVLGILQAGSAYLPIDTETTPPDRIRYLLEHGQVRFALTQEHLRSGFDWPSGVQPLVITREEPDGLPAPSPLEPLQEPTDLAYVIYTSGSTGAPKGVMIEHRAALNTVVDLNQRFRVGEEDRILALSSLAFDLSVYDVFGLLAAGGAVVLPRAEARRDPSHWVELARQHGVTLWNSVPKLLEMLAEYVGDRRELWPASLRLALASGDWIPLSLPPRLWALAGRGLELVGLGGATEASIWSNAYPIQEVREEWKSIPYGSPLLNQYFEVYDEALNPRPTWVPGELFIGGVGLARGYWRDEEKTRRSFITHPRTGARLYRTGDLGRYLPDGTLEFLGRNDSQVKLRGYRVELGEIEATLNKHPAVEASCLLLREKGAGRKQGTLPGDQELIAYLVPRGEGLDLGEVRSYLRSKLPEYMVPSHLVPLDAIPLSSNGKVDRQALPDVARAEAAGTSEQSRVPPRNALELRLHQLWSELLGGSSLGVTDDFFALGGDSVQIIRVLARVRMELGVELAVRNFFEQPTIEHLARLIDAKGGQGGERALLPLRARGKRPPLFLVHPVGGSALSYFKLVRWLHEEQPLHGLQAFGVDSGLPRPWGIEEMAAAYLEEVRSVQRDGPFVLGGWSLGGAVAFEMARQLLAAGQEVAGVVLLDSWAPLGEPVAPVTDEHSLFEWFLQDQEGRFEPAEARRLELPPAREDQAELWRLYEVYKANARALRGYVPRAVACPLQLLRASETPPARFSDHPALRRPALGSREQGWSGLSPHPIRVRDIPGNHYTMMADVHARALASALEEALSELWKRSP